MKSKEWKINKNDTKTIEEISLKHNVSNIIANILLNRGIKEEKEIELFLNPTRNDFHDPFLLNDMSLAVERIIKAVNNRENILIYGDYDVDGITSTTILKSFLDEQGAKVNTYIPNRIEEGYGINKKAIDELKGVNSLIITVDCGITAIDEVIYAKENKLDVIITDHHEPLELLPEAIAVINPKRKDSTYPFSQLAGVGVVFKLLQALTISLKLEEVEFLKYLDLVCVGTISDIVPLIDENRVITKLGLKLLKQTKNCGLLSLIKASRYKTIDSSAISYGIAPRINASR